MTAPLIISLRPSRRLLGAAALSVAPLLAAGAQATLSVQGYGYPPSQFSTRALGSGGSTAESDPFTPVNPATIAVFPSRIVFFQMEPEYRVVRSPNGTEGTVTARYPVVFGAMPVGRGWVVSIGSSTLVDRTSTTTFLSSQIVSPTDSVLMTTKFAIDGAMNDARIAAAWTPRSWLRVGAGVHAITGHNLINLSQTFADTVRFAAFAQQTTLGFSGSALSGGFQLLSNSLVFSASGRLGGRIRVSQEDTVLARARVPNRFGASLGYTGIANSFITVRTSYDDWAALEGLGTPATHSVSGWDTSIGADIAGPKLANRAIFLRAGARTRTLPFQAADKTVTENSFSGGLGTGFANGRVLTDVALIRAFRSADLSASERAWTISFGISVRP